MNKSDALMVQPGLALSRIPFNALMLTATGSLLLNLVVVVRFESALAFVLALVGNCFLIKPSEATQFFNKIQNWGKKYKINIAATLFCLVGTIYFLDYMATPADAQFFNQTEEWLRSSFPLGSGGGGGGGSVDVYSLVFNSLRALFVLYLAVSLARVIAAARNDEDWQNLARTPMIILVTVTMGDILAGLITG